VGVTGKPLGQAAYQLEIANLGVAMPEQFIASPTAHREAETAKAHRG